jgi:hypothetical protein
MDDGSLGVTSKTLDMLVTFRRLAFAATLWPSVPTSVHRVEVPQF